MITNSAITPPTAPAIAAVILGLLGFGFPVAVEEGDVDVVECEPPVDV